MVDIELVGGLKYFSIFTYPLSSKYLLRFGVLGMFLGVQIPPHQVFGSLGMFSPRTLGKISNLTCAYFSDGLVQPPTS